MAGWRKNTFLLIPFIAFSFIVVLKFLYSRFNEFRHGYRLKFYILYSRFDLWSWHNHFSRYLILTLLQPIIHFILLENFLIVCWWLYDLHREFIWLLFSRLFRTFSSLLIRSFLSGLGSWFWSRIWIVWSSFCLWKCILKSFGRGFRRRIVLYGPLLMFKI